MTRDVRLLAIVGPPTLSESRLVDACREAVAGGVTAVQVRLKTAPAATIYRVTEALLGALEVPVYVNDRSDVAIASGAHGVHLGAEDVPPAAVRRFAPHSFRIGVSVGSETEAAAVRDVDVDYWSVGSVFATVTKPDAGPPIGSTGFQRLAALAPSAMTVIAIGGVSAANAGEILAAGAHGIAVSQAIFGAPDVEAAARALRSIVEEIGR
jgi:thiamine-phosphate pyrophosphorylase